MPRVQFLALALSGAVAGLVGANFVLGYKHYYEDGFSGGIGYMGIAVAVLGRARPLGVVAAALLFGTLSQGALAVNAVVPKEIVDVLTAVIIFSVAAAAPTVRRRLARRGAVVIATARSSLGFAAAVVRITVPYALAALGGTLSERSGVINIALEGLLLVGAFAATMGAWFGHGAVAGVLGGVAGGAAFGALYALLVVTLARRSDRLRRRAQPARRRADALSPQGHLRLVVELAAHRRLGRRRHAPHRAHRRARRALARRRLQDAVRACACAPSASIRRRRPRSACDRRASAGSALVLAGALAGLGGAWLAADQRQFVAGMSNGRGYIALAAMIFGGWRPVRAAAACLLFGLAEALQIALQAAGVGVPGWAVQMLPYVLTMVTLAGFIGRSQRAARAR